MDQPGQRSYEVIQVLLELWERKKGEQAAMLDHPSEGSVSRGLAAGALARFRNTESTSGGEGSKPEDPEGVTRRAQ